MTQNPNLHKQNVGDQATTCEVCHQTFKSDRELQDHMQNAHSQRKQSGGQTEDHDLAPDQREQEKIA